MADTDTSTTPTWVMTGRYCFIAPLSRKGARFFKFSYQEDKPPFRHQIGPGSWAEGAIKLTMCLVLSLFSIFTTCHMLMDICHMLLAIETGLKLRDTAGLPALRNFRNSGAPELSTSVMPSQAPVH